MGEIRICQMDDADSFTALSQFIEQQHPDLRLSRFEINNTESLLRSGQGGMKIYWIYRGTGEVMLPAGYRTKEGDGQPLPREYAAEPIDAAFAKKLHVLQDGIDSVLPAARTPVAAILSRWTGATYVGDFANELWKLVHAPDPWSENEKVTQTIMWLFSVYRKYGYSIKQAYTAEPIQAGDQLIVAANETLQVQGSFSCLTFEKIDRRTRHIPTAMRLRYLRDTSGGCNFDFDPFRRLPLTWYMNLRGETGDGVNFVNSHVINIARETSPTHFHPAQSPDGRTPQNEMYLVLDPEMYDLNTYGRKGKLVVYPDLHDLNRYEEYVLAPGNFLYIPAGTGHRGIDVFVNVLTIPGFKPNNEYYIDQDVHAATSGKGLANENLLGLKNYQTLEPLI